MKKVSIFVLMLCGGFQLLSFAGMNIWTSSGIYGGEVNTVVVDYQTPNVIYAGLNSNGVLKSMNWGQSWETASNGLYPQTTVHALVIHPELHRTLFIGTELYAVYKSTDGGKNWVSARSGIPPSITVLSLAINPTSPDTLYAGTADSGIFKSINGGENWVSASSGIPIQYTNYLSIQIDPASPNIVYAAMNTGIYKSTHGGGNWTAVNNGLAHTTVDALAIDPFSTDTLYAGIFNGGPEGGVFKSTNGGESWEWASQGLDIPGGTVLCVIIHPNLTNTIYVGTSQTGVYKSTNAGESWEPANNGIADITVMALFMDPKLHNTIYAGTSGGGIFRSTPDSDWLQTSFGMNSIRVMSIALDPLEENTIYAGTFGGYGLWKSTNSGRTWEAANTGLRKYVYSLAIDPTDNNIIFAGTSSEVYKSTDGGGNWAMTGRLPDETTINAVIHSLAIDSSQVQTVFTGSNHGLFKTLDSGENWTRSGFSDTEVFAVIIHPDDHETLYVGTQNQGVQKCTDGGDIWAPVNNGLTDLDIRRLVMDPVEHDTLYAVSQNEGVFRTIDGGQNWTAINTGLTASWIYCLALDPDSPEIIYAGTYGALYRSADAGENWEVDSSFPYETSIESLAIESWGKTTIYAGSYKGLNSFTSTTEPNVKILHRATQTGSVNQTLKSQILPATHLTCILDSSSLPDVSGENPAIMQIQLPQGITLSQTLATGTLDTANPHPTKNEVIFPLAISEYAFNTDSGTYQPVPSSTAASLLDPDAVQMLRYVKEESQIWIRINCSTTDWEPDSPDNFLGFTIGVGAGVWPVSSGSNWGAEGQNSQENTQFFTDVREYDFKAENNTIPVSIEIFYQHTHNPVSTTIDPGQLNLLRLDQGLTTDAFNSSRMGTKISDFETTDLNLDGIDDLITIDESLRRLTWAFGRSDGTYEDINWIETVGIEPATIDAADVTGDGRPDILVGSSEGFLNIYNWETLFGKTAFGDGFTRPAIMVKTPGAPSASVIYDVNLDGNSDYIFTDEDADTLNIMFGPDFAETDSFPSGTMPNALTIGDFNGDSIPDIAVTNNDSNSVTVYRNDGIGQFTSTAHPIPLGSLPADITSADLNRDGRSDLVVALQESKLISAWLAGADGNFTPEQAQNLYFMNVPSAIHAENFDGEHGSDVLVGFQDYYMLALCTTNESGLLSHAYSINTLGDMEMDPVNHVTLTEDNILSVAGGTGAGGVCERNGAVSLGDKAFNLIHFPRSRNISFSVVSLVDNALLNLELYQDTGSYVKSCTQSLAPGQQFARYLTDESLLGADAGQTQRWVRAFLTQRDTYGLWLANDGESLEYLDGLKLPDIRDARSQFALPAIHDDPDGFTQAILINPSEKQAHVHISLFETGAMTDSYSVMLNGRGRVVINANDVFSSLTAESFLLIQSDRPIIGCELFGDDHAIAALDAFSVDHEPGLLYCPHIAVGDLGEAYESILTIVNASDEDAILSLRLYDDDGNFLAGEPSFNLPAWTKVRRNVAELFDLSDPTTGYVVVDPQGATCIIGCITFGENGDGRFLSCLPLLLTGHNRFLAGHMANGTLDSLAYFTGIAILNPDTINKTIQITAYDQTGFQLESVSTTVSGNARDVFLLDQKMPDLTSIFGGYLIIENQTEPSTGLQVFVLFGDQPVNFLSAVTAIGLD